MDDVKFNKLPLEDQAEVVKRHGNLVEAQDYYSYRVLHYTLDQHTVELLYDFDDKLIEVSFVEEKPPTKFVERQIESQIQDPPIFTD